MPMNMIIREKRKEIGLTQEQIAECLGVSTPAVNKWEKGTTYPDISLLPALARLLKTDLNTLLCFNEGLSEQEISHFCKGVMDTIGENGFESGFTMVIDKVQKYPSCGSLLHTTALLLDGALMMSGMIDENKERYSSQITALYKRAAKSDDDNIRDKATFMLASKYMGHEEYDKAQEMLDLLPERSAMDKSQLQANLWIKQGKLTEAAELLERKLLMMESNEIQSILISLEEIALKEGNNEDAARLAEISCEAAGLFGLWDYCSFVAPLQVASHQENVRDSISILKSILAATLKPWEMKKSALYRHIAIKSHQGNFGKKMLPALLAEIENDSRYAFLHSNTEFQQLIEQYRARC
ncbi:transcriptional repressor DicA [Ruminiclostridium hungatei]|uniref:Transcriptional repressor DicA n=1 Tax=Ruminiclostridium hungatei TaxID=48256 RepID=A0A1V4SEB7_RUMHU|nr:helix-turn-helix transcriptional regulator [Ruminiclostridium hungatei]OPX42262.1 transcriptional repressor DicA [Ruminiclostridium hungatei]